MVKLALLREDQIWGDNALPTFKKVGTLHKTNNLVAILGGIVTIDISSVDLRLPVAWTASPDPFGKVRCVNYYGKKIWSFPQARRPAIRPVISPEEAANIILTDLEEDEHHIITGKYGEFPRTVADEQTSSLLEGLCQNKKLSQTGKIYVFDVTNMDDEHMDCNPRGYHEYVYNGKKYIRISGRQSNRKNWPFAFVPVEERSQLEWVEPKKPYWVRVEPIKWYLDESGYLVSAECISAGFQFSKRKAYNGNFENTFMNPYLKRLSEEIEVVKVNEQEQQMVPPSKVAKHPSVSKKKNDGRGRV